MRTLYLIDASIYVFRAYFTLPDSMQDKQGWPVNAVYGYATFLCQLIERVNPAYIAVAFDGSLRSSFRNKIYSAYKANRDEAPDELKRQFKRCQQITEAMGIRCYKSNQYEADDIIGCLSYQLRKSDFKMVYVTSDKDIAQLMKSRDVFWDYAKDKKYKVADVKQAFGVKANQMIDLLALAGDSADNIPGVPGVGKKTAIALLENFSSFRKLYENIDSVCDVKMRGAARVQSLLIEHEEQARISYQLATIVCNAKFDSGVRKLKRQQIDGKKLKGLCTRLNFGERLRRRFEALEINC